MQCIRLDLVLPRLSKPIRSADDWQEEGGPHRNGWPDDGSRHRISGHRWGCSPAWTFRRGLRADPWDPIRIIPARESDPLTPLSALPALTQPGRTLLPRTTE